MEAYRNGEVMALVAPIFRRQPEELRNVLIIVETTEGYVETHGLGDPDKPEYMTIHRAMQLAHNGLRAMAIGYQDSLENTLREVIYDDSWSTSETRTGQDRTPEQEP